MIDREKVTSVLLKRFPGASPQEVAAAANAIVGLAQEYEPVEAAAIDDFTCVAGPSHYRLVDVASGRVRLFRRLPGPR